MSQRMMNEHHDVTPGLSELGRPGLVLDLEMEEFKV